MKSCTNALFIVALTIVAFAVSLHVSAMDLPNTQMSALRDAAVELHSCLNEDAKVSRADSFTDDRGDLIVAEFELSEACGALVTIACRINAAEQLSNCVSLGENSFHALLGLLEWDAPDLDYMDADEFLYDAPAHSRTPPTLQLILDELNAPVTQE